MEMVKVKTKALDYIKTVLVVLDKYENGALYIGLYNTREHELYNDLSTYIMPVLPGQFYVLTGSECERFANEQSTLFTALNRKVKSGFNTYALYQYNGQEN